MRNLKVGDIVKIVNKRGNHWNPNGHMDKWKNKIVTIKSIDYSSRRKKIKIHDDYDDPDRWGRGGWEWHEEDFIPATNVEISEYVKENRGCLKKGI